MPWLWSKKYTHQTPPVSATKATYVDKATQTEESHPERPQVYYPTRQSNLISEKFTQQKSSRQDKSPSKSNSVRIPSGASAEIEEQLKSSTVEKRSTLAEGSISGWLNGVGEVLLPRQAESRRRLPIPIIFEKDEVDNLFLD
jgi:hypothetical protein